MRLHELSSDALLSSLRAALGDEKRLVAKVIAYLVEVETRRLHLELACSSMFEFCTKRLGLSESETFRRLTAARLVRRFPTLLDAIASARVHLSSVVLLRDLFTEANVEALIGAAAGKTKREVEELVARLAPKPNVAASFRKLPVRSNTQSTLGAPTEVARSTELAVPPTVASARSTPKPSIAPLSEERYRLQLTASSAFKEKLERARELMSHRNPSGDMAVTLERALDVLIEKLERQKLGKSDRPRGKSRPSRDPARVVNAVRRQVASRDEEQCSYRGPTGERCSARRFLEFDHRQPRAHGGTGELENIRLYCRAHNGYAAERVFGREFIAERIRLSRSKCDRADSPTETTGPREPSAQLRDTVKKALHGMGFGQKESAQSLAILTPETWGRPVEDILREAISALTT